MSGRSLANEFFMTVLEAVVLGLVQGLTEFLPISSTAHLRIVPALLGWGDPGAAYSAVIQLGTVAAVLVYFARDIVSLTRAFFRGLIDRKPFGTEQSRLAWFVGLGSLPLGVLGLLLEKSIETTFRSLYVIATSLIVLAVVLFVVERTAKHTRSIADMTLKDGLIVGLWQALALIPGSSRSGSTITGALSLGLTREAAARYSFLLSIPATTGAGLWKLRHVLKAESAPPVLMMSIGIAVSFVTGLFAMWGLLAYLRTRSTMVFIVYRILLGVALIALVASGVVAA